VTPPIAPPTGFRLATPGNWFDLDLDLSTRNASIAALVDARIAAAPEIGQRRQDVLRTLRRAARDAAERGVSMASMMVEAPDGQGMSASVHVALLKVGAGDDGGPPVTHPELIRDLLAGTASGGGWRHPAAVEVRHLPAGTAVRLSGLRETDVPGATGALISSALQYYIPVPGTEAVALLSFSTPVVALTELFERLFDAIAASFEFQWARGGRLEMSTPAPAITRSANPPDSTEIR